MQTRHLASLLVTLICLPVSAAQALSLNVWNVTELAASDDYIDLQLDSTGTRTTLTMQWIGGATDTPGAIGVDKLFINNTSRTLSVVGVFMNTISALTDITSAWLPTNGGLNAGGGFGTFVEKVAEPAGSGGIAPDSLIFVLDGAYAASSFVPNSNGATFAAHVRYANGCSGWVADGGREGSSGSDGNCGGASAVPEPSAALVFGAGLLVVGVAMRRRY